MQKATIVLAILTTILVIIASLQYNKISQLEINNKLLNITFQKYRQETTDKINQLEQQNTELEQENQELRDTVDQLQSNLKTEKQQYQILEKETEETINLIDDYKQELKSSMEWFSINSNLTLPGTKLRYLEKNCFDYDDDSCSVLTACFSLLNDEKLDYVYKFDNETSGSADKLQSLEEFMENEGGDCEDYSLFYKAEWNILLDNCQDKEIEIESYHLGEESERTRHYVDFDKDWYLTEPVNEISFTGYKYPNVVCGSMFDPNTQTINGHCMIAITKDKLKDKDDITKLDDSILIEPQTGEYRGMMNENICLEPCHNNESYVYQVITDHDHYLFSYDREEWLSHSYFLDVLNEKQISLQETIR